MTDNQIFGTWLISLSIFSIYFALLVSFAFYLDGKFNKFNHNSNLAQWIILLGFAIPMFLIGVFFLK